MGKSLLCAEEGYRFLFFPADLVYMWYPELKMLDGYCYEESRFNILLLGGSVLTEEWGDIPRFLKEKFEDAYGGEINIINLAASEIYLRKKEVKGQ